MLNKLFYRYFLVLLMLAASSVGIYGQNASNLTLSELQSVAGQYVSSGDFAGGLPYLEELLRRFGSDPEHRAVKEVVVFFMGRAYMQQYSMGDQNALQKAADTFKRYIEEFPDGQDYQFALVNVADCLRGLGKFLEATPYLKEIITHREASEKMREDAREKLVQAYYVKQAWEEGLDSFLNVLRDSRVYETRAYAATAAMQAYISLGRIDEALELLPHVTGNNPARYNLSFNLALLKAGDNLVKEKSYIRASLLFTMTLTLDTIREYYNKRIDQLNARISELEISTSEEAPSLIAEARTDIQNTQNQLDAIAEVKDYTPELHVRIARTYVQTGRDWEGFWAYLQLINEHPDHDLIELFTYSAFAQAKKTDMPEYVRQLGERYLDNPAFKKYRAEVSIQLAQYYHEREQYKRFFEIADRFIEESPNHNYTAQFAYLMGDAYLKLRDPETMLTKFSDLLERYPRSPMVDGLLFWSGLASIFTDRMQLAFERFDRIVREFRSSPYFTDSIYRSGVAAFGLENYEESRKRMHRLIDEYPEAKVRGEAEYFLGQIYGMEGTFDSLQKALMHYRNVEKYTDVHHYIQESYFKMAELLDINEMYSEMAETLRRYINTYPEEGNVTEATFKLGSAYEKMGRPNEMLNEYLRAIKRFGNDAHREGIDSIIEAYPVKYYEKFNTMQANLQFLEKAVDDEEFLKRLVGWISEPPINPETGRPTQDPRTFRPYRDKRFVFQYFGGKSEEKEPFDPTLVDDSITRPFQRDDKFVRGLLVDKGPLVDMLKKWQEMKREFPQDTPEEAFLPMYENAQSIGDKTLMFRLMRALQDMGQSVGYDYFFTVDDFEHGSPSLIVWMGEQSLEAGALDIAKAAWERVAELGPTSLAAMEAMMNLGDMYAERHEDYATAFEYYKKAQANFPAAERTSEAAIKQGDMLRKQGKWNEANEVYGTIMKTPSWRGPRHAEASYKAGLTFFQAGDFVNAHTILNRTFLSHSFHKEWAAKAYVKDAEALVKLGKPEEARMTLQEFFDTEGMKETDAYPQALKLQRSLES